jgi:hypothetical protein
MCLALVGVTVLGSSSSLGGVVISELHYHAPAQAGWLVEFVEVHNPSGLAVSLGGWALEGGIQFTFPAAVVLPPQGYVVVGQDCEVLESTFGVTNCAGEFDGALSNGGEEIILVDQFNALVDAVTYDDKRPWPDAADGSGDSLQRLCSTAPSWDPRNWTAHNPTPTAPPLIAGCPPPAYQTPAVVLNELHYHPQPSEEFHSASSDGDAEEYVELYNPLAQSVDLSGWRLTDGIAVAFPNGTVLGAGEYLVVGRDRDKLQATFGIANVLPVNFNGRLSNSGERIALEDFQGNLIDSVVYRDCMAWPYSADGLGLSLERISPDRPSNDVASWRASLPLPTAFQRVEGEGGEGDDRSHFLVSIDGPGELLVDNLVLEDAANPGVNLLTNGNFDSGAAGWSSGTSSALFFAPGQGTGGSGALRIISSAACPHDECDTARSVSLPVAVLDFQGSYRVSADVRYVSGSPFIRVGLLRGAQAYIRDAVSPGRVNTRFSSEEPLVIGHVNRYPRQPRDFDPVWITARVRSSLNPTVTLTYEARTAGAAPVEGTLQMFDNGQDRDHRADDGVFGTDMLPFPHNTEVRFRIRAQVGARSVESPEARHPGSPLPEEVWGYYVNDLQPASKLPTCQLILPEVQGAEIFSINTYFNFNCDIVRTGSFACQGDLYPDVRVRFRGNTMCFVLKRNFKVTFNRGRHFGGAKKINLNSEWTDKSMVRDHLAWDFLRQLGTPYTETEHSRLHINGEYFGLYLCVEHPDERFLARNGLDGGGNLYKAKEPFRDPADPNAPVIGVVQQSSADAYRDFWEEESNEGTDFSDVSGFIDDMHADGESAGGPSIAFWEERMFPEMIIDYQVGQVVLNNFDSTVKNHFLYHDLDQDRWGFIPWDQDLTFGKFFDPAVRPVGTLNDIMLGDLGLAIDPWLSTTVANALLLRNHLINFFFNAGGAHFQRAYLIRLWDILAEKYTAEAYAPRLADLGFFLFQEEQEDRERWGRYTSNVPDFPADMLSNLDIVKDQIDRHHTSLRDYILLNHGASIAFHKRVQITELMYQPEGGNDDLQFLELLNTSIGEADISGWSIQGISNAAKTGPFTFPEGSIIPADEAFIVARNPDLFRIRYVGRQLPQIFGPYAGKLGNGGEELRVLDAGPGFAATVDYLRYDQRDPWPRALPGHSIELTDPTDPTELPAIERDNDVPEHWVASAASGGTPGRTHPIFLRGDANFDGMLNLSDSIFTLAYLFQGGEEPICLDAIDSDDNGKLDLTDVIFTLRFLFQGGAPPPEPFPDEGRDLVLDDLGCLI